MDPEDAVNQLRERFLCEYQENGDLYDERDVQRIRDCDFFVERFINFLNQGPEKAFEHMKECCQMRKAYGMAEMGQKDFPEEIFQSGAVFPYLPDKEGNIVIHIRPKICAKLKKDHADKLEKYCMYVANQVDDLTRREFSWGLVLNAGDLSVSDVDLNFVFSILPRFRKFFPNGCQYCVIYGLHWSVNAICKMAIAAMPADSAKKIRFYRKEQELHALISKQHLPDFLNGAAERDYQQFPTLSMLMEVQQLGNDIPLAD